jgi:hypothetical protein
LLAAIANHCTVADWIMFNFENVALSALLPLGLKLSEAAYGKFLLGLTDSHNELFILK